MFRFSLRFLLVFTTIIALIMALPMRRAMKQSRGRQWVAAQRGHVTFEHGMPERKEWFGSGPDLTVPGWLVDLVGIDFFNPVTSVMLDCEEVTDLEPITDLETLESLAINIEMKDGLDLSPLVKMPRLKSVYFTNWTYVTKEQLLALKRSRPGLIVDSDVHGVIELNENSEGSNGL